VQWSLSTDAFDLVILEHPQEPHLRRQWQLADLGENQLPR